jgi:lipopolysaccharide/colanic/teichoic acid biosynthesis glycosyltransferase
MRFTSFLRKSRQSQEFQRLCDKARFHYALERERARADRWEQPLSLLSLGAADAKRGEATLRQVAGFLRDRMRLTDEAGWLDSRHIGVLMPNTPGWGAWTLADEICLAFPDSAPLPHCKVYCYPTDWFLGDGKRLSDAAEAPVEEGATEAMERLFFRSLPVWKRMIDIFGSSLFLLVHLPILLLLAGLVKLMSPGPVFFRQTRIGLGGRPFTMYKFRTMVADAEQLKEDLQEMNEQEGPVFKIENDPRVTFLGRYLRKFSLDEFPQMWNVLKGDMSLVGPRPPLGEEVAKYEAWQRRRLDITPGLTCFWQVRGRSRVSFKDWMRLDIRYIKERSAWCDLRLLLETIPAIVTGRGAC